MNAVCNKAQYHFKSFDCHEFKRCQTVSFRNSSHCTRIKRTKIAFPELLHRCYKCEKAELANPQKDKRPSSALVKSNSHHQQQSSSIAAA